MKTTLCFLSVLFGVGLHVSAQNLDLPQTALKDEASLERAIPALAKQSLVLYQETDSSRFLNTLFRLQEVAGQYQDAVATLQSLMNLRRVTDPASTLPLLPFEILARAKAKQATSSETLEELFNQEFRQEIGRLDDKTASESFYWFGGNVNRAHTSLLSAVEKQKGKDTISLQDAVSLIKQYQFYKDIQFWQPLVIPLMVEDDGRRYITDNDVLIKTPDGATIAAMMVRPRSAKTPLPALLLFTIYADDNRYFFDARKPAARGYASVVAYTRGKGRSPEEPVPYEHDGDDARAVIDWISKQPWNDGRIGMYGGSYDGFTQWATTKKIHPALKTIVPYVANNPGDGLPMENNVFLFVNYAWAFYTTDNKYLDNETYYDFDRWNLLNDKWYKSGKSYRQIPDIDGTPNPWFKRWLQHPAYDAYWQNMVPYKEDFRKINIPVLTITGYYDDGQQSAVGYLKEHYKFNKKAEHYLLIGPYDHFGAQAARKPAVLRDYVIDPVAQINTPEITFEWMDYIFRGAKKPDLLKNRINYQVMGTNTWKHAPSLEKMSTSTLTLYLTDVKSGEFYQLSGKKPAKAAFLSQIVNLADRQTNNNDDSYPDPIIHEIPDFSSGFAFISDPLEEAVEISGIFSGEIRAEINKKDMDVGLVLYEVMPDSQLFHLSYFIGRASYAQDGSVRHLLTPGRVESIPFEKTRMVSKKLGKGSRLLITLDINKNPFAQINYGTGKEVSDEDISDAEIPLNIRWYNDSYVRIPIWK
ncbi:MAG: CocE/NonD family hydrolase [Bacteroidetes bacterium]|nr:CocE/NonD family hydrolase [Bacteroidota bacterium]